MKEICNADWLTQPWVINGGQRYPIESWVTQSKSQVTKYPNCLCSINMRQLEMLLQRTRPKSPTYLQDHTIVFIQLKNVCNEIKNKVLPCYVKFPCHKVAQHRESHPIFSIKNNLKQTLEDVGLS